MNSEQFSWEGFVSRGYGPAAEVPLVLEQARSLTTNDEVLDSGERVRFFEDQRRLLESVVRAIARGDKLRRIAERGSASDRFHALAVLHLADCLSRADDPELLARTLAFVTSDGCARSPSIIRWITGPPS